VKRKTCKSMRLCRIMFNFSIQSSRRVHCFCPLGCESMSRSLMPPETVRPGESFPACKASVGLGPSCLLARKLFVSPVTVQALGDLATGTTDVLRNLHQGSPFNFQPTHYGCAMNFSHPPRLSQVRVSSKALEALLTKEQKLALINSFSSTPTGSPTRDSSQIRSLERSLSSARKSDSLLTW